MSNEAMIQLRQLKMAFGSKVILDNLDLAVRQGETLAVIGPSGTGKSTIIKLLTGLLPPTSGSIVIDGQEVSAFTEDEWDGLRQHMGVVFQYSALFDFLSVGENVAFGLRRHFKLPEEEIQERVGKLLEMVGMPNTQYMLPAELSGGMKQRIGIALILLHLPRILVVDEPTAGLDPRERIRFRNLLVELSKDRIVIFSTHIIEDISSSCSQVVVINKGELKYFGDPTDMVDMATGKVWQFHIDRESFEQVLDKTMVVHHIQDGDTIQVRYLSVGSPYEGAVEVEPNLEDAYLCLLKNMEGKSGQ